MKVVKFRVWILSGVSLVILAGGIILIDYLLKSPSVPQQVLKLHTTPNVEPTPVPTISMKKGLQDWVKEYGQLPLADAHNHGSVLGISDKLELWQKSSIDRVVLFGEVSKSISVIHDMTTWRSYLKYPDLIVPFFSGINLKDTKNLQVAREQLEKGFFGIGEIAAASIYSPAVSNAEWKANDPMDGILPQLYELCAEYKAPLLLHIDPPSGYPIIKLEEALKAYPDTNFIFAHANAYNSPLNIEELLNKYKNLYIDFFAGFTAFNPDSSYNLVDFVRIMRKFPDRFMLSTDSGYDMKQGEEQAIEGMYMMLDLLKDDQDLVRMVAYDNLDALIRNQPATRTQKEMIQDLDLKTGEQHNVSSITKLEAGRILNKVYKTVENLP